MAGIPSDLFKELRETLLNCGPVADDQQLQRAFNDPQISAWRYSVPQASNPVDRVEALIDYLHNKRRAKSRENALVLFLRVWSERRTPVDDCNDRLADLAYKLERALREDEAETAAPRPATAGRDIYARYEVGLQRLMDRLHKKRVDTSEALAYEHRLLENIGRTRRSGDNELRRSERNEVIEQLNALALTELGESFTALCGER